MLNSTLDPTAETKSIAVLLLFEVKVIWSSTSSGIDKEQVCALIINFLTELCHHVETSNIWDGTAANLLFRQEALVFAALP
jgi:hypothetical protein